jgi:peptidoglycan/xylan/chitin deacetylase (PgdA/CDA1 family)
LAASARGYRISVPDRFDQELRNAGLDEQGTPVSGALALTFDDGPDACSTPRVLASLERLDAGATFFMLGERVEAAPDVARSVLAAGGDVQLHGYRHLRHSELDEREIEDDTCAALAGARRGE